MMGLEEKDWPLMFELTNKVLGAGDPEYQTDVPEDRARHRRRRPPDRRHGLHGR